jgi:ABC-type branched-subunit amino acid transport system ATPase component
MQPQPILKVNNITVRFGSLAANQNVSIEVFPGEITGLIGPNGAGKTTLFNAITGLIAPDEGSVMFKDHNVTGFLPHQICRLGMSRTFQVTKAFIHMTVEDTIRVGAYNRCDEKNVLAKVDEVIEFCELSDLRKKLCADIGLASLRKVELARALATGPEILLLDETGAGLNPTELEGFMSLLKRLNKDLKITLCVVEHVMQMVMGVCQRIFVLDSGELIATGSPAEISANEKVIQAYLGKRVAKCY